MPRKIKPPTPALSSTNKKVLLDWRAYFIAFCEQHGEPIESGGRLLFPDGWTYSSSNYEGPEFPPPTNNGELDVLILEYWTIRQSTLTKAMRKMLHEKEVLERMQSEHSLPLQQIVMVEDEDRKRRSSKPLNLEGLTLQMQWVADDLIECNQRLKEIAEYHKQREVG